MCVTGTPGIKRWEYRVILIKTGSFAHDAIGRACVAGVDSGRSVVGCDLVFFFQAEDGIRDLTVTGVQTCALPICAVRASLTMEHREANRRRGTTAERFLTAATSATGVVMILPRRVTRPGVLAPEELAPQDLLPELENRGVKFHMEDLSV